MPRWRSRVVTEATNPHDVLGPEVTERLGTLGVDASAVARAALVVVGAFRSNGKVLLFGNGGSAADAQHVAAEFVGRFERDRAGLPAIALTTDTSALTAIANDFGYERVFSRQVEALGRPGDVAIAISASGRSANVLEAVAEAKGRGLHTLGLSGAGPSPLAEAVDIAIEAPRDTTASVQEVHLIVEHAICSAVETRLFANEAAEQPVVGPRVLALDELVALREDWRRAGLTVVWTNGVFDLLHIGHLRGLEAARRLGDVLVVGVNNDDAVRELKGPSRPLVPAAERADMLAALRPVDFVVVFDETTPEAALDALRPDIHCKGADYAPPDGKPIPEQALVESYGGRVEFLPLVEERSTTGLAESLERDG
jgi:phosphoheptose isomerase